MDSHAKSSPPPGRDDEPKARSVADSRTGEPMQADLPGAQGGVADAMVSANKRQVLGMTHRSVTHKFSIAGHEGYLTVGLFEDDTAGEIFIKMSKEGSTLSGLIQGFCRAFSLALQFGLPLQDAVDRFRGMRFEPMGTTSNPEIPECTSILDYVARYLELNFVDRAQRG
jgi:ribonucleoside-diphosphate reductase alpha chain